MKGDKMSQPFSRDPVFLVDTMDTLRIIMDPLRSQIVSILNQEPMTIGQVAGKMGLSSSRLYYHFNLLEEHGLIRVVKTRQVNNIIEKIYWLTAEDIDIKKDLINFSSDSGAENIARMVTSSLDATREDVLRSLQARKFHLSRGARPNPRDMVLIQIKKRLDDATYQDFLKEFRALLEAFSELPDADRDGEDVGVYNLVCYAYPSYYYDEDTGSGEKQERKCDDEE